MFTEFNHCKNCTLYIVNRNLLNNSRRLNQMLFIYLLRSFCSISMDKFRIEWFSQLQPTNSLSVSISLPITEQVAISERLLAVGLTNSSALLTLLNSALLLLHVIAHCIFLQCLYVVTEGADCCNEPGITFYPI